MIVRRLLLLIAACVMPFPLLAQSNPAARAARQWRQKNEHIVLSEFVDFLRIPNVTRDAANIQRNAEHIVAMMKRRGITSRLVTVEGANPVVYGEIRTPNAKRTIAFYAHYDAQPVVDSEWTTPPFSPTLRTDSVERGGTVIALPDSTSHLPPEARLYARSAGDDKVSIMAMLSAVDALHEKALTMKSNIKFVFEGEEEAGSEHLEKILAGNRDLFSADLWIICDGPLHQTRRPLIYFGARDSVTLDVTIYGARTALHSGHYGNWAPNAAMMMAKLLASMKDDDGRVLVEHFYDDVEPLGELERQAVADSPDIDRQLMNELWIGASEGAPKKLAQLITEPALNVRGLSSAHVGAAASNIIPSSATASIDLRLVKGMDSARTQDRVVEHIRKQGFFIVDTEPSGEVRMAHPRVAWVKRGPSGGRAARTPMDLPIAQEVVRVVESVRGTAVKLPNMGGSLPLTEIERPLGTHTIVIPIANHDDRQHTFDENLRVQNLWDGIEVMAALLSM